ncbi:ABC transporter substrate-binding protein [Clostridium sp. DL1XJH146]
MRRVISVVTAVMMSMMLFTDCGGEVSNKDANNSAANNSAENNDATEENQKIVIGYAQIGAESGWRTAETESIKSTIEADKNVDLVFSDAQQKQENQIKAIRSFIAQEVDVIALSPVVESGWETVLGEAKDAEIPVILVDRGIETEDESLYKTLIASDFVHEGNLAGEWLVEKLGEDATVNVVELQGTVGASAATDRMTGFAEIMDKYDGYNIIKSQTGDFTRSKGKEVMEAFLKSDGDNIDVVYAHNDDMALGAIQAIKEAGYKPGEDIVVISVDGVKGIFEAIEAGEANCTVECTPLLGPELVEAAKALVNGEELPKWTVSNDRVFAEEDAVAELPNRVY